MVALSKNSFVGVRSGRGAVAYAIVWFNEGTAHISQVMVKLAIERKYIMNIYIEAMDNEQMHKVTVASKQ